MSGSVPRRILGPLQELLSRATAGAVFLLAAAALALVWANSPFRASYTDLWGTDVVVGVGRWAIREDLRHWVNDGLMTLFFLLAGLEIKRELTSGELRDRRRAALPVLAALGGMVVPALLYLVANAGHAGVRGWGMAMPTDMALVLGVLALASPRVPTSLKAFVVTLAIADDVGTIVAVLVAYSHDARRGGRSPPSPWSGRSCCSAGSTFGGPPCTWCSGVPVARDARCRSQPDPRRRGDGAAGTGRAVRAAGRPGGTAPSPAPSTCCCRGSRSPCCRCSPSRTAAWSCPPPR